MDYSKLGKNGLCVLAIINIVIGCDIFDGLMTIADVTALINKILIGE